MKTQIALSVLTALSASICCITPVLAIIGGMGSLATSFHWLEPCGWCLQGAESVQKAVIEHRGNPIWTL